MRGWRGVCRSIRVARTADRIFGGEAVAAGGVQLKEAADVGLERAAVARGVLDRGRGHAKLRCPACTQARAQKKEKVSPNSSGSVPYHLTGSSGYTSKLLQSPGPVTLGMYGETSVCMCQTQCGRARAHLGQQLVPVDGLEVLLRLDVVRAAVQVAEAQRQIDLQQAANELLLVVVEVAARR